MRLLELFSHTLYFKEDLYEMSNFGSDITGLPPKTKLWVREEPKTLPHIKYRIKISNPQYGSAVFGIWGDEPRQVAGKWKVSGKFLQAIQDLMKNKSQAIKLLIDGEITTDQLIDIFKNHE